MFDGTFISTVLRGEPLKHAQESYRTQKKKLTERIKSIIFNLDPKLRHLCRRSRARECKKSWSQMCVLECHMILNISCAQIFIGIGNYNWSFRCYTDWNFAPGLQDPRVFLKDSSTTLQIPQIKDYWTVSWGTLCAQVHHQHSFRTCCYAVQMPTASILWITPLFFWLWLLRHQKMYWTPFNSCVNLERMLITATACSSAKHRFISPQR